MGDDLAAVETRRSRPWSLRGAHVSLGTALAASLGALMLVAVGSVWLVALGGAGRNTFELLQDKANLTLASIEQSVRQHLDPVAAQTAYLKMLIESFPADGVDLDQLTTNLRAALAATPQVVATAFVEAQSGRMVRVERDGDLSEGEWTRIPELMRLVERARGGDALGWLAPNWNAILNQTIIPLAVPIIRDGRVFGILISAVATRRLSALVASLSTREQTTFILYGRDLVLAHPRLVAGDPDASAIRSLPPLATFPDAALASIWDPGRRTVDLGASPERDAGHTLDVAGTSWLYIYRALGGYGTVEWTLGAAGQADALGRELGRLWWISVVASGLLLAAVVVAVLFGRRIAAPMIAVARVARSVQALDLTSVPRLPRSRVREIDEAATALNSMVAALRWFELYLPRRLVHQLLAQGEAGSQHPVEQHVSVMFTDIRGFSRLAARMSVGEVAAFLNEHLGLVGGCIEASGGTIDKYIGDSVMAFWGAPEAQPDHLARACDAARRIAVAVAADNRARGHRGLEPLCVRVGIASGEALVGNIGAPGRLNYTLIGDVVNVAQRLEQLGKEIDQECEVIALLGRIGEDGSPLPAGAAPIGGRTLRDRDGQVEVFRLI